jgi:sugar phosphate isomerase/epimerase
MTVGIPDAIAALRNRIVSLHVHDNHGTKDEHLWPGDGSIDWQDTTKRLSALAAPPAAVLEIGYSLGDLPAAVPDRIRRAFGQLELL